MVSYPASQPHNVGIAPYKNSTRFQATNIITTSKATKARVIQRSRRHTYSLPRFILFVNLNLLRIFPDIRHDVLLDQFPLAASNAEDEIVEGRPAENINVIAYRSNVSICSVRSGKGGFQTYQYLVHPSD